MRDFKSVAIAVLLLIVYALSAAFAACECDALRFKELRPLLAVLAVAFGMALVLPSNRRSS